MNDLGGLVTIPGPDGKPVQVPANILQAQIQNQTTPGIESMFSSNYKGR